MGDDDGSVITGGSGSVTGGGVSIVGDSVVVVDGGSLWIIGVVDGDNEGSGVIGVSGVIESVIGDDVVVVFSVVIIGNDSGGVGVGV
jgi:hypothetical protein